MLQGPIGPFFKELADHLKREGHTVHKINLFGGDEAFFPKGTPYTGSLTNWPSYLIRTCQDAHITDIILFGDRRVYHEQAIEVLSEANPNIRVWVFEEGYFRPDWITMDHFGTNFRSHLPNSLESLREFSNEKQPLPKTEYVKMPDWISEVIPDIARYFTIGFLKNGKFPDFTYHRKDPILMELFGWAMKTAKERTYQNPEADLEAFRSDARKGNHFVLALQLDSDFQIRKYSPVVRSNKELIKRAIHSFHKNADPKSLLVVKAHPFDFKWGRIQKVVTDVAEEYGLSDRVYFINKAPFGEILYSAKGLITINSTCALLSMDNGIPTKALGKAFWNFSPLTNIDVELDKFWTHARAPEQKAFQKLKSTIMHYTQFNGSFYSREGRRIGIQNVLPTLSYGEQDTKNLSRPFIERLHEKRQRKLSEKREGLQFKPKKIDMSV